jgi:radical SAM superfamily enzyme YgiQ (UPF0313 family)
LGARSLRAVWPNPGTFRAGDVSKTSRSLIRSGARSRPANCDGVGSRVRSGACFEELAPGSIPIMNVLLIYPEFPDTFWSFKHALRFIRKNAAHPPLGLLTVASMLPPDFERRLVDLNVRALTAQDLAWADCAFISAMGLQRDSARSLIDRCHRAGVRIVAGGPLFTAEPEQFPEVDHLVLGEAELSLPPFLDDLKRGDPQHLYKASGFADVQTTPIPSWELIEPDDYGTMSVQYSRGCPFDCEFCDITALWGRRPRVKQAAQIIAELDALYSRGWRGGVFFVDDNLIGNKRRLKTELLPALIERRRQKPGLNFNTQASINLADDPDLMNAMVAAGFDMIFVGIESPSEESLAECSKRHNLGRDMSADVRRMLQAGLQVQGGFIVGFDADTPSTFERLTEFIQSTGIVTAMVGLLQAIPGTRLYERLKQAGRLEEQFSGYNVDGNTNIVPAMGVGVLRARYAALVRRLYSPRVYYQRVRIFLRAYRVPHIDARWELRYLLRQWGAFFLAAVRLGIAGKERFEYWKLLVWTALRRPRAFPLAVTLAIYGYHFRRTCEAYLE